MRSKGSFYPGTFLFLRLRARRPRQEEAVGITCAFWDHSALLGYWISFLFSSVDCSELPFTVTGERRLRRRVTRAHIYDSFACEGRLSHALGREHSVRDGRWLTSEFQCSQWWNDVHQCSRVHQSSHRFRPSLVLDIYQSSLTSLLAAALLVLFPNSSHSQQ